MSFLSKLVDMMLGDPLEGNVRGLVSLDVEPPKGSGQLVTSKKPPTVFVCGGDESPGPRRTNCPNELHDWPLPAGYTDSYVVANRRMRKGWKTRQCECGLYGWIPGPDANPAHRVTLEGAARDLSDYYQI